VPPKAESTQVSAQFGTFDISNVDEDEAVGAEWVAEPVAVDWWVEEPVEAALLLDPEEQN
jgi:hypothetical protein